MNILFFSQYKKNLNIFAYLSPSPMKNPLTTSIKNHNEKVKEALIANLSLIEYHIPKKHGRWPSLKSIIPHIEPTPQTVCYIPAQISVKSRDNPLLEYVPSLPVKRRFYTFYGYTSTALKQPPYGYVDAVIDNFADTSKGLTNTSSDDEDGSGYDKTVADILNKHMSKTQKLLTKAESSASDSYELFCSSCRMFECGVCVIKEPKRSNKSSEVCRECMCSDFFTNNESIDRFSYQNYDLIKGLEDVFEEASGDICLTTMTYYMRHGVYFSCEYVKKIIGSRRKSKASNLTVSQDMSHVDQPQLVSSLDRRIDHFCDECSQVYKICDCASCGTDCPCRAFSVSCTSHCYHRSCNNLVLSAPKTVYVAPSTTFGHGCFAGEPIRCGDYVASYVGEIISDSETDRRGFFYDKRRCSYLFSLEKGKLSVDATYVGSSTRFINHNRKKANVCAVRVSHGGCMKIYFFAVRNVALGNEIFFDYNYGVYQKRLYGILDD